MLRAGVIGWPVVHSLSPQIHRFWLAKYRIAGRYEAVFVPPESLEERIDRFRVGGWSGFNVTIPHKESIIPLLDSIDAGARAIGAVNTVVAVGDGYFEGRNTDAPGFLASLRSCRAIRVDRPAAVLGAGGASRAVLAALTWCGVSEIRIANRNRDRASELAAAFPATVYDWDDRHRMLDGAGLLVNSTSLGMSGQPPLDIDLTRLPQTAIVNDIVYRPLETALLAAARTRGNPIVDGLGMLPDQAAEGFAAWFGVVPLVTPALRDHILAAIEYGK